LIVARRSPRRCSTFKVWKQNAEFFAVLAEFVHEDLKKHEEVVGREVVHFIAKCL